MRHSFSLFLKAAFWAAVLVVAVLSLLPVDYLPPQSLNIWDKAQHASGFALLTLLGVAAYPARLLRLCPGLLLFGGAIELAQAATGWRYGDWLDLLADALGIAAVAMPALWLLRRRAVLKPN